MATASATTFMAQLSRANYAFHYVFSGAAASLGPDDVAAVTAVGEAVINKVRMQGLGVSPPLCRLGTHSNQATALNISS